MRQALGRVPVPLGLKQAARARATAIEPDRVLRLPWWHWRAPLPIPAAAAALILLGGLAVFWMHGPTDDYAQFRTDVIAQTWAQAPHTQMSSRDLGQIRAWLHQRGVDGGFMLPAGLSDMQPVGCAAFEWRGHKIGFLCLDSGVRHYHFYVTPESAFNNPPPEDYPLFDQWGRWKTAAWSHGGKTYLLSGMNTLTFVKRLRKAGQWNWSS